MSAPAALQSRFARACRAGAALILTSSNRLICATIFAKAYGTGRNCPGHEARLCGHESQIASWGSHSAGMRKPSAAGAFPEPVFLTTDCTDDTDSIHEQQVLSPCHPCNPWLILQSMNRFVR